MLPLHRAVTLDTLFGNPSRSKSAHVVEEIDSVIADSIYSQMTF